MTVYKLGEGINQVTLSIIIKWAEQLSSGVSKEEWINVENNIDTNIWTKGPKIYEMAIRCTADEKSKLETLYTSRTYIPFYENDIITRWFFIIRINSVFAEEEHETSPWKITLSILEKYKYIGISGFDIDTLLVKLFTVSSPIDVRLIKNNIINGGFETGDFTGWTNGDSSVVSSKSYSGTYSAQLNDGGLLGWCNQEGLNVSTDELYEGLPFSLWYYHEYGAGAGKVKITFTFSDATTKSTTWQGPISTWNQVILTNDWFPSGKIITGIKIEAVTCQIWIDNVELWTG